MTRKKLLTDTLVSLVTLALFFLASLLIHNLFDASELVPAVFVLACCLIALFTNSYIHGIVSSLISVLAVNYAFTIPYFKFNFTMQENITSAVIMIAVTLITCTLTTRSKRAAAIRAEAEREKMRANLLRAVSHDLRTPLTTIYGASSTIYENYDGISDERRLEMLKSITKDSEWLIRMVENLLSVTKLDGGVVSITKTPTVLDELVDSVLTKFNRRHPDIHTLIDLPEELVVIPMDPMLIEQVLINLFENAAEHATGMTKLSLSVKLLGRVAIFEVSDNGKGIDEATLPYVFSGKIRDDSKSSHGFGIGLSVCASILKAHGAIISAKNLDTGGASFTFELQTEDPCSEIKEKENSNE